MTSIIPSPYPYSYPYQVPDSSNSQQVTNPISFPPQDSPQKIVYQQYIKETGTIKPGQPNINETGIIKPGRPKAKYFFGDYENGEIIENDTKFKKELDDIKKINIELEKRLNELNKSSNYSRGRSRDRYSRNSSRRNSRSRSRDRYSRRNSRSRSRERSRERYSRNSSRRNSRERYSRNSSRRNSRERYSDYNSRRNSRERYSRNSSRRNSRERSDTKKRRNISIGQYKITPCKYGHNCKHRYAYIHRKGDDCTYLHEGDRDEKNNLVPVSREMAMRLYLKYKNN